MNNKKIDNMNVSVIIVDEVINGTTIPCEPMIWCGEEDAKKVFEDLKNFAKMYNKDYAYEEGENFCVSYGYNESQNHYLVRLYNNICVRGIRV